MGNTLVDLAVQAKRLTCYFPLNFLKRYPTGSLIITLKTSEIHSKSMTLDYSKFQLGR